MVKEPAARYDIDIRKNLCVSVEFHKNLYAVFYDGTAIFQRIVEHMTKELTDTFHDDKSSLRHGYLKRRIGSGKKNTANCRQKQIVVGAGVPAPLHEDRVIACARMRACLSSSTSETSLMTCHPGKLPVDVVLKIFQ